MRARALCILGTAMALAAGAPARAQRADENAVTAAEDAFGTTVGFQSVGLYNANDARGFSPQQAGNLRIEGLYFDQQTWVTGDCMVRETTMRIGIAAQSYSFPAPTGIADLSLRKPGDKLLFERDPHPRTVRGRDRGCRGAAAPARGPPGHRPVCRLSA